MSTIVKDHVADGSTVYTDGLPTFVGLNAAGCRSGCLAGTIWCALKRARSSLNYE
jgi:hypothetical protein